MTVSEFIQIFQQQEGNRLIVLAKDAEGKGFSKLEWCARLCRAAVRADHAKWKWGYRDRRILLRHRPARKKHVCLHYGSDRKDQVSSQPEKRLCVADPGIEALSAQLASLLG